jgi:serine/threonine protein kinase
MSSLCDPHTVTTHEIGEDRDGTPFIAMELLHGESLADRFAASGSLHWRTVLSIVRATCSSLAEAHALGIVHRDLKPANIFLARHPTPDFVKVLDFGIAKVLHGSRMDDGSELTRAGQVIGTLEYMSPEQLIGGELDNRTDIFTLGVVAYEMITGQRPFADATGVTGLVTSLMTRRPPPPSTIARGALPPELDGVLLRCLERDAVNRFASVHDLVRAIDRMLASRDELVTTQRVWNRPSPMLALREDAEDELTWIDARLPEGIALDDTVTAAPDPAFDHAVRDQVLAAPAFVSWESAGESRAWRAAGTGVPGFGAPQPGPGPVPHADQFAVGTTPAAQPVPSIALRLVIWSVLLAALGLGLGVAIAKLAS